MIFIGYSEAYKFIDSDTDKVVISRDARCLEEDDRTNEATNPEVVEFECDPETTDETPDEIPTQVEFEEDLSEAESTLIQEEQQPESGDSSIEFLSSSQEVPDSPLPRRSERGTKGKTPARYAESLNIIYKHQSAPRTYEEAVADPESEMWIAAIEDELKYLKENHIWDLVKFPAERKAIRC
ncbi:uncharacterized protein LOC134288149 [Aedes albopictus]|uniref:Retroviral polymerase SH3-like domain-containing protein n=1 Tax=Aedes albopictus TaxID=7160 RepID=A0ABM1Y9J2_AEDAL